MRRAIARALGALLLAGSASLAALPAWAVRAAGGEDLIRALESAPASVVADVLSSEALDGFSYTARLRVESTLVGVAEPAAVLHIAWEELAPSRSPRFARGDRVLLALERLPGASIWQTRIPDAAQRSVTLAVALRSNAFLRSPSPGSINELSHYLLLEAEERRGPTGVGYLATLAARGELPLAISAVERLAQVPHLDGALGAGGAEALVMALLRADATAELQRALLERIAAQRLESLRPALKARARDELPPPLVLSALAALDDGLAPGDEKRLLTADASLEHRRVGARWARGPDAASLLARVAREDPDPLVRSNALLRLTEIEGAAGVGRIAAGLYDADPSVRATAATSLGSLGDDAVPELREVVESGRPDAVRAAVTALMLTRTDSGNAALLEIAATHAEPAVRKLARVALGEDLSHTH
jgi:hypothetical protein